MEENKFIIVRDDDHDLAAQWDRKTIMFKSREEAEEFSMLFPGFFMGVECGTVELESCYEGYEYIYYKDLINLESFKEVMERLAN